MQAFPNEEKALIRILTEILLRRDSQSLHLCSNFKSSLLKSIVNLTIGLP